MVLNQEHGDAQRLAQSAQQPPQFFHLVVIEPAGRLVEQKEFRAARQGARQLDPLLRAEG